MSKVMQQLLEHKAARSNEAAENIAFSEAALDPWAGG